MVRIAEHEAEIARVEKLCHTLAPGPLRRDAFRYLTRLQKELKECKMFIKEAEKNATNRT